jgi:hypothetical protein
LRLLPGDEGFGTWVAAIHTFIGDVKAALIEHFGDETTVQGQQVLADIDATFPLFEEPL